MKKKAKIVMVISCVGLITLSMFSYIYLLKDNSKLIMKDYTSQEVIETMGIPSLEVPDKNSEKLTTYVYWNYTYDFSIVKSFPFFHISSKRIDIILEDGKVKEKYESWFSGIQ